MKTLTRRSFFSMAFGLYFSAGFSHPVFAHLSASSLILMGRRCNLDTTNQWGCEKSAFMARIAQTALPVEKYRSLPLWERLALINSDINQTPYISDQTRFGVSNNWTTPQDFFRNGGDCEDYALAKYAILAQSGTALDDMFLLGLRHKTSCQPHACLAVKTGKEHVMLDNTARKLIGEKDYANDFDILYALCHRGIWQPVS